MTSKNQRIRIIGERRDQIDLRALADLIVAAAAHKPRDEAADETEYGSVRRLTPHPRATKRAGR